MTTSPSGMTIDEIQESLTGFDEIAIEKNFGFDPYLDAERKPIGILRALVFVHLRRQGQNDAQAKQAVLEMTLKQVNDYFAEDDEVDAEQPVTEPGKGDEPLT